MIPVVYHGWGLEWRSDNRLDGKVRQWMWESPRHPVFFQTRREARAYAAAKYGYIRNRPDLRAEPHGWQMPRVAQVTMTITLEEA